MSESDWVEIPTYQCVFCIKKDTDKCEFIDTGKKECVNYEKDF